MRCQEHNCKLNSPLPRLSLAHLVPHPPPRHSLCRRGAPSRVQSPSVINSAT
ncbi:hypothetical protein BDZ97DRAFT_1800637, partial [Flammula alnicola]